MHAKPASAAQSPQHSHACLSHALQFSDPNKQLSACEHHSAHLPPTSTALIMCQALLLKERRLEARIRATLERAGRAQAAREPLRHAWPEAVLLQCFRGAIMTAQDTGTQATEQHQCLRTNCSGHIWLCVSLH
jgi:hypothetical protein